MASATTNEGSIRKPLRVWPGVALLVLQWLGWQVVPRVLPDVPEAALYGTMGAIAAGPLIGLWWLFFSRAARVERFGAVVLTVASVAAARPLLHESVAQGNMGFQYYLYVVPLLSLTFVVWAAAMRGLADGVRRATMVVAILAGCGAMILARSKGITGSGAPELTWRWAPTAEERLLAAGTLPPAPPPRVRTPQPPEEAGSDDPEIAAIPDKPKPAADGPAADLAAVAPPDGSGAEPSPSAAVAWPGFRGPAREGVVPGVRVATDWSASPPVELWRRPIGPGVSSFAADAERLYTQEQRGDEEIVAAYDLDTGHPVWAHRDARRHWDSHVGAGPRATPTLANGRVHALGATGILNALDAADGSVVWSREAAADTGAEVPLWGFVSSPLVVDDLVVIHVGALAAYDRATGEPRWTGPTTGSYSSPQLVSLGGVAQILLLDQSGVRSFAPADGTLLWEHDWPGIGITQPALTGGGDLLVSQVDDMAVPIGTRRLHVARAGDAWAVEERWTTNRLKPSFSPFVVHGAYAYGFDGTLVSCIDVERGERQWKGGRYGTGQLVLLPEQDLLLVVTEEGELALVDAKPDGFEERARVPAITGKTWNQPALVGDVLLVRNGVEMAAFRLPRVEG